MRIKKKRIVYLLIVFKSIIILEVGRGFDCSKIFFIKGFLINLNVNELVIRFIVYNVGVMIFSLCVFVKVWVFCKDII